VLRREYAGCMREPEHERRVRALGGVQRVCVRTGLRVGRRAGIEACARDAPLADDLREHDSRCVHVEHALRERERHRLGHHRQRRREEGADADDVRRVRPL
jgi:hypothetical protein